MTKKDVPLCFHCGSKLILISEVTEKAEGSTFPRTISKYRCSNKECQDEIDRQTAKRMKLKKEKEEMDKKRAKAKLKKTKK